MKTNDLQGQSIFKLAGVETDSLMLRRVIEDINLGLSRATQFILYDRERNGLAVIALCFPIVRNTSVVGCDIHFRQSGAIQICDAFDESYCPHVLVSLDAPHLIHMVNEKFSHRFGCPPDKALGKPLGSTLGSSPDSWDRLLAAAAEGQIARGRISIGSTALGLPASPDSDDVVFVPVAEAPNGRLRHALVLFSPCHDRCSMSESDDSADSLSILTTSPARSLSPQPADPLRNPAPAARPMAALPTILPRRKTLADGTAAPAAPAAPVVVTPEVLDGVRGLPLRRAAAAVGVSPTAFKKACRKLGLRRWAYQRAKGKRGPYIRYRLRAGLATPASCPAETLPCDSSSSSSAAAPADDMAPEAAAWLCGADCGADSVDCGGGNGGYGAGESASDTDWDSLLDSEAPAVDDGLVLQMLGESWGLQGAGSC